MKSTNHHQNRRKNLAWEEYDEEQQPTFTKPLLRAPMIKAEKEKKVRVSTAKLKVNISYLPSFFPFPVIYITYIYLLNFLISHNCKALAHMPYINTHTLHTVALPFIPILTFQAIQVLLT